MPQHPETVELKGFKGGLNNRNRPERTAPDYLKTALNIDIDKTGGVHLRKGYTQVASGASYHSLYAIGDLMYVVKDGTLCYLNKDYTTTAIDTAVDDAKVSYTYINGEVYYTCENTTGIIDTISRRSWGIQVPPVQPTLSSTTGNLYAGKYQVAIVYADADRRTGGARLANVITLSADNSGITISGIPTSADSNVTQVWIYCSTQNGEELYYVKAISNGTSSTTISNIHGAIVPLPSLGINPAPAGHLSAYHGSRIYVAKDNVVYFSDAFTYSWFNLTRSFWQFPSRITMIMPVSDGLYIGTENALYWLFGTEPESMNLEEKELCRPIMNSNVKIPSAYITIENTPLGPKWLFTADEGIYVAMNQGVVFNLTAANVSMPQAAEACATFMQQNGINRYISLLKNQNTERQSMAVGDLITAKVVRNGVVIG